MSNNHALSPWIRRFLMEHVIQERNLARNTQASYRDTLTLLLPFVAVKIKQPIDQLEVNHLSADLVRLFLQYLEQDRKCSIATRNTRLAAIHALARFIGERSPEHLAWCGEIRSIPFKKAAKPGTTYLDKPEMDALLNVPDRNTAQGSRDYGMLMFLYNTGARADEAASLTIRNLNLAGSPPCVKLIGKGNKERMCPLWSLTAALLGSMAGGRPSEDLLFLNRRRQPLTRFGIHALVKRCVQKATQQTPSFAKKRVSPHTLRHTTAVHLLRAGTDINTIRAWLGHVSVDTTNVYAQVDLEMKAKALAHCEILTPAKKRRHWKDSPELMAFLNAL